MQYADTVHYAAGKKLSFFWCGWDIATMLELESYLFRFGTGIKSIVFDMIPFKSMY
jgi:hypothetical protein